MIYIIWTNILEIEENFLFKITEKGKQREGDYDT